MVKNDVSLTSRSSLIL